MKERVRENRKKNNMLSKLDRAQLRELTRQVSNNSQFSSPAEMVPGDPLGNGINRGALVKAIKESMSSEEISRRIYMISEKIREEHRKNSILRKLDRAQLKELAQLVSTSSNTTKMCKPALIRIVRTSLTSEDIKNRVVEISNRRWNGNLYRL